MVSELIFVNGYAVTVKVYCSSTLCVVVFEFVFADFSCGCVSAHPSDNSTNEVSMVVGEIIVFHCDVFSVKVCYSSGYICTVFNEFVVCYHGIVGSQLYGSSNHSCGVINEFVIIDGCAFSGYVCSSRTFQSCGVNYVVINYCGEISFNIYCSSTSVGEGICYCVV